MDKKWACEIFHKHLFEYMYKMEGWCEQVCHDLDIQRYFEKQEDIGRQLESVNIDLNDRMQQLYAIFCINEWVEEDEYQMDQGYEPINPEFMSNADSPMEWYDNNIKDFQISSCTVPIRDCIIEFICMVTANGLHDDSPSFLRLKDFYFQLQLFHNLFEPVPLGAWEDMADDTNLENALESVDLKSEGMKFMSSSPYFLYLPPKCGNAGRDAADATRHRLLRRDVQVVRNGVVLAGPPA